MRIAPEGWPFILPGWTLVLLGAWVARGSAWLWVPEGLLLLLAVWLLVFFRDPARTGPRGDGYVIAPADGRIVDIAAVDEPMYLHARATRISIFMSVFDVHVNRYPASGTIELVRYNKEHSCTRRPTRRASTTSRPPWASARPPGRSSCGRSR